MPYVFYMYIEVKTKMSALRTRDLTRGMSGTEKREVAGARGSISKMIALLIYWLPEFE